MRNNKVLYLLPQSLSPAAAIPNLLVCKTFHSSWQSRIFKVHSHKIRINQKEETGRCHVNRVINVKISSNGLYRHQWLHVWCIERNIFHCATSKHKKTNIQADGHSTKQLAVFFKMSVSGNNTKTEKLSRLQKTDIKQNSLCFYGREIRGIWTSSLQRTLKKFRGKKTHRYREEKVNANGVKVLTFEASTWKTTQEFFVLFLQIFCRSEFLSIDNAFLAQGCSSSVTHLRMNCWIS